MKKGILIVVGLVLLLGISGSFYTLDETEQAVITLFGKPVGEPVKTAGIHLKIPLVHTVNRFEKRWLEWDGDANQITTRDKKYIWVDTYARWHISDPLKYFQTVGDERGAQSRLDDIIDGETRVAAAKYDLIELVRSTNRAMDLTTSGGSDRSGQFDFDVKLGRAKVAAQILENIRKVVPNYGIEVVDFRIKRLNYVRDVRKKVYERMISERKRIAEQYRSEGQGKKAEIIGRTQKELQKIQSEAYRKAEVIKGKADAEATKIYAEAYSRDPDLYRFLKNLEAMNATVRKQDIFVTTTDSEFYEILKRYR